jgi:hypothetical protein
MPSAPKDIHLPNLEDVDKVIHESARLIIMSAAEAAKRQEKELAGYLSQYYSLRPDVVLVLFVDNELWQTYLLKKVEGLPRRQRP